MRSLAFITYTLLRITICTLIFSACTFTSETKKKVKHKDDCTILIYQPAYEDTVISKENSFVTLTVKVPELLTVYYLNPGEILITPTFDSIYLRDQALVYGNFNPTFVNLVHKNHFASWTFAKSTRPKSGDIEVSLQLPGYKRDNSIDGYLYLKENGKATYQNNPFSENDKYEIQFTPKFTEILQKLKNQK